MKKINTLIWAPLLLVGLIAGLALLSSSCTQKETHYYISGGDEGKGDVAVLKIVSTSPADNDQGVALDSSITVTFNNALDPVTVTNTAFTLKDDKGTAIAGDVSMKDMTAIFKPSANLSYNTTYTATASGAIKGASGNELGADYVWKFTTTGTPWNGTIQIGSPTMDVPQGITVDQAGNIYVAGWTAGDIGGGRQGSEDLFLMKFAANGEKTWVKQLGESGKSTHGEGVAVDKSGNVYVAGKTDGCLDPSIACMQGQKALIAMYDVSGNIAKGWPRQIGVAGLKYSANGVVLDADGNAYIAVSIENNVHSINAYKYDQAGNEMPGWQQERNLQTTYTVLDAAGDKQGDVYVAGLLAEDAFFMKYNAKGELGNNILIASEDQKGDIAYGIAADSQGNIYVVGKTNGHMKGCSNLGASDIFLAKYDTAENQVWIRQFGTDSIDAGLAVAVDANDNIYVAGLTFGSFSGFTSAGKGDYVLLKFSPEGTQLWAQQYGTPDEDAAQGVAVDSNGNIYVVGQTAGEMDGNKKSGDLDVFVVKYDPSGNKQ